MLSDISVIIPIYNESENIPRLCSELDKFFVKYSELNFEIIFVDDGSSDDSIQTILSGLNRNKYKIIKLSKNFGSHPALRAGILHSEGKYTTFTYADLQDPLEIIIRMHELCVKGNSIAWAARNKSASGFWGRIFSKAYAMLMRKIVNPKFPKNGFDVVMFDDKVRNFLNGNIESNSSIFLQILNSGFKQDNIKYEKLKRAAGNSKWTLSKKIKLFVDSVVAFSYIPIRMVTIGGIIIFVAGIIWTFYIVIRHFTAGDMTPGWPTLISILMLCFGFTNISLGIIAEYLWRTLDASRSRPVFVIDKIIEVNEAETIS